MTDNPLIHSMAKFAPITLAVLDIVNAKEVCEIGAGHGGNSMVLCDWLVERNGRLTSIDPAPGSAFLDWLQTHRTHVHHLAALSPDVIAGLPAQDAWFIDGDHNWLTVRLELEAIRLRQRDGGKPMLAFVHRVGWPSARRDMYYAPGRIPDEFRQPYSWNDGAAGNSPERGSGFSDRSRFAVATNSGGPRNGVLTAVEDFLAAHEDEFAWIDIPRLFGLGVIFDRNHPMVDQLTAFLSPLHDDQHDKPPHDHASRETTSSDREAQECNSVRLQMMTGRPRQIRRIIFTGDVLRPGAAGGPPAADPSTEWLMRILNWPLRQVTDLPITSVTWNRGFDTFGFYDAFGVAPDHDGWASVHYATELPPAAERLVEEAFADALVISGELTPCLGAALTRLGIPVIDMIGHPLRFLEDLLNAWRSNHIEVSNAFVPFRFDPNDVHRQAGLIRAKMAWQPAMNGPSDTALLMGQVGNDRALIHHGEGRLLSFADYVEQLVEIGRRHARVLYKPHPYENGYGRSAAVINSIGAFQRTTANFYWLVNQDVVSSVYAISSGTCVEAPYFGKHAKTLHQPLYAFDAATPDPYGLSNPVPVQSAWLWPRFWQAVLAPLLPVGAVRFEDPLFQPNRIRRSLNADWTYGAIDAVISPQLF